MRIILVATEYVTEEENFDGGLANYTHRAALALRGANHEPIVVVASKDCGILVCDDIEVHRVPVVWYKPWVKHLNDWLPGSDWILVSYALNREIKKIHRSSATDIVQYTSLGATALFRPKTIPAITRLSSYQKLVDEAYEFQETAVIRRHQFLERKALCRVDGVFGPSQKVAGAVRRDLGLDIDIIESPFVPCASGVDQTTFLEIDQILKGRPYLLFFGTLGLLKGVKTIADTILRLLGKYTGHCFVFVGKDQGLEGVSAIQYVRNKAGPFLDRVIYHERVPRSALPPIIENSCTVVLPSRIDNFPNTCLEAMAQRRIVVGTRDTGFDQLITHGENGFLCERDDAQSLYGVLEIVLELSERQAAEIGERAYQRTLLVSPEKIAGQLCAAYDKVRRRYRAHRARG